jgi:hypothetical protein
MILTDLDALGPGAATLAVGTVLAVATPLVIGVRRRVAALGARSDAARVPGRRMRDAGASALEWAVISAILITAAVVIGGVIYNVVSNKSDAIQACGSLGASAQNCDQ